MALSSNNTTKTAKLRVDVDPAIVATFKDEACDPRGLYEACFDGMLRMGQLSQPGVASTAAVGYFSVPMQFPDGTKLSLNLKGLYEKLAEILQAQKRPSFTKPDTVKANDVRESLVQEGVFEVTRRGYTMRVDPSRPAYSSAGSNLDLMG